MDKPTVYLLLSLKDKRTYIGSTNDLKRRLLEHNQGKNKSTKNRRPFKLIYKEELATLLEARKREQFLKTRSGRKELKEIFKRINIGS